MTVPRLPLHQLSAPSSPHATNPTNNPSSEVPVPVPPFTPLAAFGTTTSHAVPLLVKYPSGEHRQVDVSPHLTLQNLRSRLGDEVDSMDLYFGDMVLNGNHKEQGEERTLEDVGIPQVYDAAGGLLGVIHDGGLDMEKRVKAVDGACKVVEKLKDGECCTEKLVRAAMSNEKSDKGDNSGDGTVGEGLGGIKEAKRNDEELGALDFSMLGGMGTPRVPPPPTPSQLIRSLSKAQPDLFPPSSARKVLTTPRHKIQRKVEDKDHDGNGHQKTWFDGVVKSFDAALQNNEVCQSSSNVAAKTRTTTRCKRFGDSKTEEYQQEQVSNAGHTTISESSGHSNSTGRGYIYSKTPSPTKRKSNTTPCTTDSKNTSPKNDSKVPKKRGRKRKFPELSDEERKALRQAQNRESAKQSRIRRKTMAAEYEKKMSTLNEENTALRDQVSLLNNRLSFLQSLLTVSVNPKKMRAASSGNAYE